MKPPIIVISGTPATGKTTVGTLIARMLNGALISITELVKEKELIVSWDLERETGNIDEETCRSALLEEIQKQESNIHEAIIIEGTMADVIGDMAGVAVVLRLHPRIVRQRLEARGYSPRKIVENVQSEILGTCTFHMREARGNDFFDIDTTAKAPDVVAGIIDGLARGERDGSLYRPGLVDWIQDETLPLDALFKEGMD